MEKMKEKFFGKNEIAIYVMLFVLAIILYFIEFRAYRWDFQVPMGVDGDGIGSVVTATDFYRSTFPWQSNQSTFYPFQRKPMFSNNDGLLINIFYGLFSKLFRSIGYGINITYMLTYPMFAICTYFAMRKLGISKTVSFIGGIIYAFFPGHWWRGIPHIYIGNVWALPIACLLPLYILQDKLHHQEILEDENYGNYIQKWWESLDKGNAFLLIGVLALMFTSVYHGFFMFILVALVGGICWLTRRKLYYFLDTFFSCGFMAIVLFLITVILPRFSNANMFASSESSRGPENVEAYALKLAQLLIPVQNHRWQPFSQITSTYMEYFNRVGNENQMAAMGLVLSVSFIIGIMMLLAVRQTQDKNIGTVQDISRLNVLIILLAGMGGLASFIGFFFYMIRCYNRFSFLIGVYAVFIFGFLLDIALNRVKNKRAIHVIICVCLVTLSLFDQVARTEEISTVSASTTSTDYQSMKAFVREVEDNYDHEANVIYCAEDGDPRYYMMSASEKLNWASPELAGSLAHYSAEVAIDIASMLDIDGIIMGDSNYIDENQIKEYLGSPLVFSDNSRWKYYSMEAAKDSPNYSQDQKQRFYQAVVESRPWYFLGDTLYFADFDNYGYRYCDGGMGVSTFYYTWTNEENVILNFEVFSPQMEDLNSSVQVTIQIPEVFGESQRLGVYANGKSVYSERLTGETTVAFETTLDNGALELKLHMPDTSTMRDLNLSDENNLSYGVALQSITIDKIGN